MNIAFNTAAAGMIAAQQQAGTAAQNVVHAASKGEEGVIQAMVAVKRAEHAHAASAAMVKVASDMTDTLLDITV